MRFLRHNFILSLLFAIISVAAFSSGSYAGIPVFCDADGPYTAECAGATTDVQLDGSGSGGFDNSIDFSWDPGDCPGTIAPFDAMSPLLTVTTSGSLACNISLTVTDDFGNSASCSANVTIDDTTPPDVACPPDTITIECDAPVPTFEPLFIDLCDPEPDITAISGIALGECEGEEMISRSMTATDSSGNASSCSQFVEILDRTPPSLSCPADISVQATSSGGAVVNYLVPSSSDNCDPGVTTATCTPLPGLFPVGTTTVECSASDDCGNTAVCLFLVEVLPPTTPEVPVDIKPMSCPNPLNVKSKGVLPVAILGTPDFDPLEVDITTVELEGVQAIQDKYEMEDVATPFNGVSGDDCHDCTEDGPDGFMDLVLYFDSQELVAALDSVEERECLYPTLTGTLLDGTPIEGTDPLRIIKKK
jgi:hypothetical protein